MLNKNPKNFGFTLIELMVAVSIFAVVAVIATGAVLTANSVNKKAQAIKQVMDNLSFALDSMTLKLKQGGGYYCNSSTLSDPPNYPGPDPLDCNSGGAAVAFKLEDETKYIYQFAVDPISGKGIIQFSQSPVGGGTMSSFVNLTASEISIDSAHSKFYVVGNGATDAQPRVLISIFGTATVGHEKSDFAVETTVSDRR